MRAFVVPSPYRWAATGLAMAVILGCGRPAEPRDLPAPSAVREPQPPATPGPTVPSPPTAPDDGPAERVPDAPVAPVAPIVDEAALSSLLRRFEGKGQEAWYGVYMQGAKVGHGVFAHRRASAEEPGRWVVAMDLELTLDAGGRKAAMKMSERRYYAAAPDLGLVATEMVLDASGMRDVRRATRADDGMHITRELNGVLQPPRTVAASEELLTGLLATSPPEPSGLSVGSQTKVRAWDWEHERDEEVVVTVKSVTPRRIAGIESSAALLELRYPRTGLALEAQVATGGALLEVRLGAALTLRQEEESIARSGVVGLDLAASGVRVDTPLGDPTQVSRLVLDARLPPGFTLASTPNQRVEPGQAPGDVRITITRGAGAVVTAEARTAALAEEPLLDWRAPAVVALARELTAERASDREKVDAVADWVYTQLTKRLATHLPTASAVLERRVGDCTEHTWLTTALLRAAGVPARPVYGLAWAGDADGAFAYHAWVEVALDGAWWPVDPTWGEPVADATHLALGDDLGRVGAAIGGLGLRVVTVERDR